MFSVANFSSTPGRAVRAWLIVVAALMFATLIVGGVTRLTQSGLSIVEWRPVTGVIPPLDGQTWQTEFEKYKTIPQYRELNPDMALAQFKTIYWWEWSHRMLARLVGCAFLLPFLWFLWRGWIAPPLQLRLWAIFGSGAVLAGIGWWMVASGLTDRTSVSQYRLAFHLTLACAILAAVIWTAAGLTQRPPTPAPARIRSTALALVALVIMQIYLGALVAGLHAGLMYNTWPLIDGSLLPSPARMFFDSPLWRNFFENPLTVQFNHRLAAYLLWLLALLHAIDVARTMPAGTGRVGALGLLAAVTLQAGLGIVTLLQGSSLPLALAHQAMAVVVLSIAVIHAERLHQRAQPAAMADVAGRALSGGKQAT